MSDLSGDDLAASILADAEGAPAPKKPSMLPTIAAVGILTVVAIGGGAGVGMMLGAKSEPAVEIAAAPPAAKEGEAAGEEGEKPPQSVILKLAPVVTTITSPAKTLLRIEASIVIHPEQVENQEMLAAQIQGDTLTFLRTVELAQVEGARGLLHLREDLRERAKLRSPAVTDFLIQSLVAQ